MRHAGADDEPINQDATATTYVVQCANGGSNGAAATSAAATSAAATSLAAATSVGPSLEDDGDACGFPIPVTVTEGPSTVAYSIVADDS